MGGRGPLGLAIGEASLPDGRITRFRNFPESLRAFLARSGYLPG
jgi:hypothetical protein